MVVVLAATKDMCIIRNPNTLNAKARFRTVDEAGIDYFRSKKIYKHKTSMKKTTNRFIRLYQRQEM